MRNKNILALALSAGLVITGASSISYAEDLATTTPTEVNYEDTTVKQGEIPTADLEAARKEAREAISGVEKINSVQFLNMKNSISNATTTEELDQIVANATKIIRDDYYPIVLNDIEHGLNYLSNKDIERYKARLDQATSKEELMAIDDEANDYDEERWDIFREIRKVEDEEEKKQFEGLAWAADSVNEMIAVKEIVKAHPALKKTKDEAYQKIDNSDLTDSQKADLKNSVFNSKGSDEITSAVDQIDQLESGNSLNALKESYKNKVNDKLDLLDDKEKQDFLSAIESATTSQEATTAYNKAYSANADKARAAEKAERENSFTSAKDEAKKYIDDLADELTADEIKSYKEAIDKAPTYQAIKDIKKDVDETIEEKKVVTEQAPYQTRRIPNADMMVGEEKVSQKGKNGVWTIKDGKKTLTTKPIDEIIEYGTKKKDANPSYIDGVIELTRAQNEYMKKLLALDHLTAAETTDYFNRIRSSKNPIEAKSIYKQAEKINNSRKPVPVPPVVDPSSPSKPTQDVIIPRPLPSTSREITVAKGYKYIKAGTYKLSYLENLRAELVEARDYNQIMANAARNLLIKYPKTVAPIKADLEKLVEESEKLQTEANEAIKELDKLLGEK